MPKLRGPIVPERLPVRKSGERSPKSAHSPSPERRRPITQRLKPLRTPDPTVGAARRMQRAWRCARARLELGHRRLAWLLCHSSDVEHTSRGSTPCWLATACGWEEAAARIQRTWRCRCAWAEIERRRLAAVIVGVSDGRINWPIAWFRDAGAAHRLATPPQTAESERISASPSDPQSIAILDPPAGMGEDDRGRLPADFGAERQEQDHHPSRRTLRPHEKKKERAPVTSPPPSDKDSSRLSLVRRLPPPVTIALSADYLPSRASPTYKLMTEASPKSPLGPLCFQEYSPGRGSPTDKSSAQFSPKCPREPLAFLSPIVRKAVINVPSKRPSDPSVFAPKRVVQPDGSPSNSPPPLPAWGSPSPRPRMRGKSMTGVLLPPLCTKVTFSTPPASRPTTINPPTHSSGGDTADAPEEPSAHPLVRLGLGTSVDCSGQALRDAQALPLIRMLRSNSAAQVVDLGKNRLTDTALLELLPVLSSPSCAIRFLALNDNLFTKASLGPFLHVMGTINRSVQHLNLSGCLRDASTHALLASLKQNTTLQTLLLERNNLRTEAVEALGEVVSNPQCALTTLSLMHNHMDDRAARLLLGALRGGNCRLTEVSCAGNSINDAHLREIRALMHSNAMVTVRQLSAVSETYGDMDALLEQPLSCTAPSKLRVGLLSPIGVLPTGGLQGRHLCPPTTLLVAL
jgi:hypothetical protein